MPCNDQARQILRPINTYWSRMKDVSMREKDKSSPSQIQGSITETNMRFIQPSKTALKWETMSKSKAALKN